MPRHGHKLPNHSHKLAITAGIVFAAFAGGGSVLADETPAAEILAPEIINARQESQITTTYELSPYLRASDIEVEVLNGDATLTGTVQDVADKELAQQIALGVSGITEVRNRITLRADNVQPAGRSFGGFVDDANISNEIKSKLIWSKHVDASDTNVDTTMGKVTLSGTANSADAKAAAEQLAMNTPGVESVDNRLVVRDTDANPEDGTRDAATGTGAVGDSWITTKVKSTLLYTSNVDGAEINVSTKDGIVTLSGKLDDWAERDLAIELAQNVRGVKRVVSNGLRT